MEVIFQKILTNNFSDFKGLTADLSIPVPQSTINEIVEAALQRNKNIESCQVSIHGQNRVSVNLKTTVFPWPLNLKLKLDKSVDLGSFSSPKIRAWLENNQLLGSLGSFFNVLPEGVKLYGEQVVLDLGSFLRTREYERLLDLVKFVGIKTEQGKVIFDVKIRVD
jgi:hypothetical protein